jgi:hypothetical protein
MSDPRVIAPGERGRLRLFAVALDEPALRALTDPDHAEADRPFITAAAALLNRPTLDLRHIELFDVADLTGLGLANYLSAAYDITEDQIAPNRTRLDGLQGFVLLLLSEALQTPEPLRPRPVVTLIATFDTPQAAISMKRLRSDTARGVLIPPETASPSTRDQTPRGALILLALIVAGLILWAGAALVR